MTCSRPAPVAVATEPVQEAHTTRLSEEQLSLVLRPSVQQLAALFDRHHHELRVAGGAVRDLLMGFVPHYLDFVTTATPQQMKTMFKEESVRVISLSSEKLGTVKVRIDDEDLECTTLRTEVWTDSRYAAAAQFTQNWYLDARWRDLTVNAMYLGLDGTVYDYFDGRKHLEERRVEFVGDPAEKIQKDCIRILRYYRFFGRIAENACGHSEDIQKAIVANADGLSRISGDRIWSELQKIVVGPHGSAMLQDMIQAGLGPHMGLPADFDIKELLEALYRCKSVGVDIRTLQPITVMATGFLYHPDAALDFIEYIKCSRRERELMFFLLDHINEAMMARTVRSAKELLAELVILEKTEEAVARVCLRELLRYACKVNHLRELNEWKLPTFPIRRGDLVAKLEDKTRMRRVLKELFRRWESSKFSLTSDELLESVRSIELRLEILAEFHD